MLERDFAKKVVNWLQKNNIYYFKKPQGKFTTRKGIADIIICIDGQFIALELKTDKGWISPEQYKEKIAVKNAGGVYIIARPKTWCDIKRWLLRLTGKIKK